ncbi:MAG: hypothetical protein LBC39_05515 [Methanobrevibacter sp.]|nr:hypothetical protein [Candidatus Methanovirga aequatorialis]
MINITIITIIDFFNSFKPDYFKTLLEISLSWRDPPKSVVDSNKKIFSCDDLKTKANSWLNKDNVNNINQNSSVDGIYYFYEENRFKLIFIEFKGFFKEDLEDLEKVKRDIKQSLKLKPLESLFCIFPHLVDEFCSEWNYSNDEKYELMLVIYNCPKAYFFVFKDFNKDGIFSEHIKSKYDFFEIKRLSKHPFDIVETLTPDTFCEFMKNK